MTQEPDRTRNITDIPMPAAILLALVLTALTSGILFLINKFEHVNSTTIALIFLLPVGAGASLWGLIPGASAALVSFLAFNYFFIPDIYTFQVKQTEDLIVLVAFLSVAFVISELTGRVRRNLDLATIREYESKRLYELNTLLTGTQDERSAARIILEKVDQTLHPDRVEILIESTPKSLLLALGLTSIKIISKRPYVIPLQTSRELIGEIRVWSSTPILEAQARVLNIIASQGVLTIERIRLGEEARKTRVLEESDRLKSSLLSSVSHELRSPLAAIKASVSSLRTEEVEWDSAARKELLTTVEEEIDHLNVLVGNLLDMSRIEAGVLKPQKKPNILAEIIETVLGRMRPQLQGLNIVLDVPEDLPLINVDYVQMQQVFTNLLTNSLKYSPPGSTIEINATLPVSNYTKVVLKNQSLPVPEADMERIFDKFYRINPSERITGAGLGLSICKGIIEAHGGKIWAENIDHGLAFNFILPVN
jgi:two-component system sensor histidine kinase KdpD